MLRADGADRFRVDFSQVTREGGFLRNLFARPPTVVDSWAVGQAIIAALRRCPFRSSNGLPQVWNEYRIFLCREDHDRLRALERAFHTEIQQMLYEEVTRSNAVTVGAFCVRLMVDDNDEVRPGQAILHVRHTPDSETVTPVAGEITMRLDRSVGSLGIAPPNPEPAEPRIPTILPPEDTQRLETAEAVLQTGGATLPLVAGVRYLIGRAHPDAPPTHLALPNATPKINRRQLSVFIDGEHAEIGREPGNSNPVWVAGQPMAPGDIRRVKMPVDVILSGGELKLVIKQPGGADPMTIAPF